MVCFHWYLGPPNEILVVFTLWYGFLANYSKRNDEEALHALGRKIIC
jgi:hypothetical protein